MKHAGKESLKARRIFQVNNVCAFCEETYPRSLLYICHRCGLMYCGNCVLFEDDKVMCLRCAVKNISPKTPRSKYMKLSVFLAKRSKFKNEITLSFAEIEEIIGDKLPKTAYEQREWWSNARGRSPSEAWLTAGWIVKDVNLEERRITFLREGKQRTINLSGSNLDKTKYKKKTSASFKSLALKAKVRENSKRPRRISKTKIAILQARLKNIERSRAMGKHAGKRRLKKVK